MEKRIFFTYHALEQMDERGATREEVELAIKNGDREPARKGRLMCRLTLPFGKVWIKKLYSYKQVVPIIAEEEDQIIVVTVFTYYFQEGDLK